MSDDTEEDFFTGVWLVEYVDETGSEVERYVTADYEVYDEQRVMHLLQEIHPDWTINKLCKAEKLPWRD